MSVIATICARGGSKGVPGKNIKMLHGKPLIVHTIERAFESGLFEDVFVSTDDEAIAEIARKSGAKVPFIRPAELAIDNAPKIPVIEHLVDWLENELAMNITTIVDLDPTSPLRTVEDIKNCYEMLDENTDVVITGYEADKNPYFNMVEEKAGSGYKLVKEIEGGVFARQKAPKVYSMNASIYVWHRNTLKKGLWGGYTKLYVMPRERSIDVDDEIDFKLVELLMNESN